MHIVSLQAIISVFNARHHLRPKQQNDVLLHHVGDTTMMAAIIVWIMYALDIHAQHVVLIKRPSVSKPLMVLELEYDFFCVNS